MPTPNLFKNLKFGTKGPLIAWGKGPSSDWQVIFLVSTLLIISISLWNFWLFLEIKKSDIARDEGRVGTSAVDLKKLEETILYYQNKAINFGNLQNASTTVPVDPSL